MSSIKTKFEVLNVKETLDVIRVSLESNQPIAIEGSPGIGKSSIVAKVAKQMGMRFEPLILSLCDPTDIGGFPVASQGKIERLPLSAIKAACDEPCILFLDETTCATPTVQGASMRMVQDRWAGDRKLHPGTRIVLAYNPPEEAAGGFDMALPLLNRITKIELVPDLKEVQDYFFTLGAEGSTLRSLSVEFAAVLEYSPSLLQLKPPASSATSGTPWGSPRAWERALTACAVAIDNGFSKTSRVFSSLLAGNVGSEKAAVYASICKYQGILPTIEELLKTPMKARLPENVDEQIAIVGVVAQVAMKDVCAAWAYTGRLKDEIKVALSSFLTRYSIEQNKESKFYKEALDVTKKMAKVIFGG